MPSNTNPVHFHTSTLTHLHTKKSQAMFFVLFILAVLSVLSAGLAVMWQSEMRTRASDRDGLIAFYLAQAGIERAKMEILNNVTFSGNAPGWYTDLDVVGDNYTFNYNCSLTIPPGFPNRRTIIGRGEILDTAGNLLAHREIQVTVDGIIDGDSDGADDNGLATLQAWSWREI